MSAGSFIEACIRKSRKDLQAANVESAAKRHKIPVEWARFYIAQELQRFDKR